MRSTRSLRTGTLRRAVVLAVVPLLVLAGCSSKSSTNAVSAASAAPTDGSLTIGLLGDIGQPPDPDIYYANNGLAIVLNAYEGLVQYQNNIDTVKIAPRLATSWTVDKTNTVYTFKLRSGVTFHDGTPLTSAAVKVAFDRRIAVKGGAAYMVQGVKSVATPDALTAVVTLKESNAAFLDYLASPFGPKMESPTGLTKNAGTDNAQTYLMTHDLGTGPYELTTAQTGTKYGMTQYAGYWGTKSPFKTINLPVYNDVSSIQLAFDKGDVATIVAALPSASLPKYHDSPSYSSYLLPTLQSALFTVNPNKTFFSGKPARTAFMQFIDQQKLVTQVLGARAEVATTVYAKGMIPGGADKQNISYQPAVFTAYAKTLPADTPMVIGYASDNTNAQQMAAIVAAQALAAGIKATAQGFPTSQVFGWANDPTKGPDAFIDGNNGPDGGNPYMWGHVFWDKSGGINYFLCDDPAVNAALDAAVKSGDTALFVKAGEQYSASGCYLNLSYNKDWVVAQKWLAGVAEAHNIGANELDFSLLSVTK